MDTFKQALKALTVKRLKEEASKYNKSLGIITGYSKMSKDQLIEEMSKHKDKFMHLMTPPAPKKEAPKPAPKKEVPKPAPKKETPKPAPTSDKEKLINEYIAISKQREEDEIYSNKVADDYEKKVREITAQGPEALKKFRIEESRKFVSELYNEAKKRFKNKDTANDLFPMIQILQRILKDHTFGLNKTEIDKFNNELKELSIRLNNVYLKQNEETLSKNKSFYDSMLKKINKGEKLNSMEKEKFNNYERIMKMVEQAKKKTEPRSEVKEAPKQTLTRDKMELMKLEVERDRFAKNKEEKQALTKQINKIKRNMKKQSK